MQAARSGLLGGTGERINGVKRIKLEVEGGKGSNGTEGDAQFLPEDVVMGSGVDEDGDGPRLSKEVRELMARYVIVSRPRSTMCR